jgi:hypothetical protein
VRLSSHFYDFGDERDVVGRHLLDSLRIHTSGPFALPATREAWKRMFTDRQWADVLRRFAHTPVLVVASEVIDIRRVVAELRGRLLRRRTASRVGWIRTADAFEALWRPTHHADRLRFVDLDAWALEPRTPEHGAHYRDRR